MCLVAVLDLQVHPVSTRRQIIQFALDFPLVTIRDMVHAQKQLIDFLGVKKIVTISGASMGGMQAMEWAANYPQYVQSIIPIAAPGRAYPQSIAYRKAQRKAIMLDADWRGGNYYKRSIPKNGIELARMMGFITYRSEPEFTHRFGRNTKADKPLDLEARFEVEEYLEYHGKKLANWFDANTYLYLSKAMDLHDLGHGQSSYEKGIQRIKAKTLVIGFDSDLLFPNYQQKEFVEILARTNNAVSYKEISTLYGHDAFLIERDQIKETIHAFLKNFDRNSEYQR